MISVAGQLITVVSSSICISFDPLHVEVLSGSFPRAPTVRIRPCLRFAKNDKQLIGKMFFFSETYKSNRLFMDFLTLFVVDEFVELIATFFR